MENGLCSLGSYAFEKCEALKQIIIPDACEAINERTFSYCRNLKSVKLGAGIKSIGERAFEVCDMLTEVIIPDSTLTIGSSAFEGCKNIAYIKLGLQTRDIGTKAFWGGSSTTALSEIQWGDSLKIIGDKAFYWSGLQKVDLPSGLQRIGRGAFECSKKIETISIPSSVDSIGLALCNSCSNLRAFVVDKGNPYFCDIDGVLYTKDCLTLLEYPNAKSSCCIVAGGTKSIAKTSFKDMNGSPNVRTLILPESVDSLYGYLSEPQSVLVWQNPNLDVCHFPYNYYTNRSFSSQDVLFIPDGSYDKCMQHDHLKRCQRIVEKSLFFTEDSLAIHVTSEGEHKAEVSLYYGSNCTNFQCPRTVSIGDVEYDIVGVGKYCFYTNRETIDSISIHQDVTYLEPFAFSNARDVVSHILSVYDINDDVFTTWTYNNATLTVPYGKKADYETANGWKNFKRIVEALPSAVKTIEAEGGNNTSTLYDLSGRWQTQAKRGVNILCDKNGKTKKVMNR
ncbi:MAG: leucine-rich repeat domain-containing protein [Bacteroidaceae bacterium]|nr:leucine-rich repeat domain-containing protein [Bacteroidaceae bacterium]